MTTRLEKTINGLKKFSDRNERSDLFEFSETQVTINCRKEKTFWIRLFVILLILITTGSFIYLVLQDNNQLLMLLLIGLSISLLILVLDISKGAKKLTVDFIKKQFVLERSHTILPRHNAHEHIDFSKVYSVTIKEKGWSGDIPHRWQRLYLNDVNSTSISFIDFPGEYPESILANKIKLFIDVVLLTYQSKETKNVQQTP